MTDNHTSTVDESHRSFIVALAMTSGATDALGFLVLGGAFTSVVTGNLVLLGASAGAPDPGLARQVTVAIMGYIMGCALGARLDDAPDHRGARPPPDVTRALAVETTIFSVCAAAWWIAHSHPTGVLALGLFALSAVAMGIQSGTFHLISGQPTTYLTGTVTTLIVRLARRHHDADDPRARSWLALVGVLAGAALGALAARHAPGWAPVTQLAPLGAVLAIAYRRRHVASR